jgi:hypothetical protein
MTSYLREIHQGPGRVSVAAMVKTGEELTIPAYVLRWLDGDTQNNYRPNLEWVTVNEAKGNPEWVTEHDTHGQPFVILDLGN